MKYNYLLAISFALSFSSTGKTQSQLIAGNSSFTNKGSADVKSEAKAGEEEIRGLLTFDLTLAFDLLKPICNANYYSTGNFYGTGELAPLGFITSRTKGCISFIDTLGQVKGVHIETQYCSFVTADGEELFLTNDPYDLRLNDLGVAIGYCNFYFAGGTGKYENATGSFVGYVENNMKGRFTVDISGTIRY